MGKLWEIDVPAFVGGEPAIPHNYWIRGLVAELVYYKRVYEHRGFIHTPNAPGVDYKMPSHVAEGARTLTQVKTTSNADGAYQVMKTAIDDLLELSAPLQPLELRILKEPGTSSNQLKNALDGYISQLSEIDQERLDFDIVPFNL